MTSASVLFIVAPCDTLADEAVFFIIMLCHPIIEGCVGVKSLNTFFIEEMLQGIHTPGADALAHHIAVYINPAKICCGVIHSAFSATSLCVKVLLIIFRELSRYLFSIDLIILFILPNLLFLLFFILSDIFAPLLFPSQEVPFVLGKLRLTLYLLVAFKTCRVKLTVFNSLS